MTLKNMLCPHCWGSRTEPGTTDGTPCGYCKATGTVIDQPLSPNFNLSEFLSSETAVRNHIPNDPSEQVVQNLQRLCSDILDAVRARFGPYRITSGYRSVALNAALGGSSKTSVHPLGQASDGHATMAGITRQNVVDFMVGSDLPFDQVIFEGTWVHIGRFAPDGVTMRREALMMFPGSDGKPHYYPYDPNDPRVGTL